MKKMQKFWTDYPFVELGDIEYSKAPVREVEIISFDGDKYCEIEVCGEVFSIKAGYIYKAEGRSGKVPRISQAELATFQKGHAHE